MTMKKLSAVLCAFAMATAMLTACGDSDSSAKSENTTTTTTTAAEAESVEDTTTTTEAPAEESAADESVAEDPAEEPVIDDGSDIEIPGGETKYYVWGGGSVTWGMDLDRDDTNNVEGTTEGNQFPGVGNDGYEEFWVGTLDSNEGTATLTIPVVKGAVVQFIAGGWENYPGVQYSVTIGDKKGEVKWASNADDPAVSDPTYTYLVEDDVTEITAEVYYYDRTEDDEEDPLYNDYCQGFVHVIYPE